MERTRTAVILVAGIGSRLRPLTDGIPKALVDVAGSSIVARALLALRRYGVNRLVLATGYREEALRRALEETPLEVVYRRNTEYETTQNSVSLALCRDELAGTAFFKLDGDVLFDPEILTRLDENPAAISVAVDRGVVLDAEAMKVKATADGRIVAFGKGIPVQDAAGESIGIERVSPAASAPLFDALDAARSRGETHLYYEDVYGRLIDGGLSASLVDVSGLRWCEVDAPEDLERARTLFP